MDEYTTISGPTAQEFDAVGKRNAETGFVPPIPEFRATSRFGWSMGRHQVTIFGRWQSEVEEDDGLCNDIGGRFVPDSIPGIPDLNAFIRTQTGAQPTCPDKLPAKTLWDVQYDFNLDGMLWGDRTARVQLGVINAFDTFPPSTAMLGGIDTFLYDPRGRQFYARFRMGL